MVHINLLSIDLIEVKYAKMHYNITAISHDNNYAIHKIHDS